MPEFTVIEASKKKDVDGKHGPMQVINVRLHNVLTGEVEAEWFTKAETPLPAKGATLEGDVTDGPYGKNFKKTSQGYGGRSPRDSRRIERQHSQEMALRFLYATSGEKGFTPEDVKKWTDWFVADLDVAGGGANIAEDGEPARRSPDTPKGAAASNAQTADNAISAKQKAFLVRLLKEKGATSEQSNLIDWWAAETLTGGRDGSASKAIDGLTGENPDETLARLLAAALAWQKTQSDIPADTEGLEDEDPTPLDQIPF